MSLVGHCLLWTTAVHVGKGCVITAELSAKQGFRTRAFSGLPFMKKRRGVLPQVGSSLLGVCLLLEAASSAVHCLNA